MLSKSNTKNFVWQGIDQKGFKIKGELNASTSQEAKIILLNQNITPLKITRNFLMTELFSRKNKITQQDIIDFSIEFSTLISADIPLSNTLNIMENSANKSVMKNLISAIKKHIENGRLLSEALQAQGKYFDTLFCQLVYAGEHSGTLDVMLKNIAAYREKMASLKRKIKKTLIYPGVVLMVSLMVTYAMLAFVIPQFERLFQSTGAELPALTQLVIGSANIAQHYGGILFLVLMAICLATKISIQCFKSWQYFFDRFLLRLPIVGKILLEAIFARCFNTLATTLRAGLPLLDTLQLTSNIAGNTLYIQAFSAVSQHIKNGQTLHAALEQTQLFSPRIVQMVRIGEESGRLDHMLQKLSEYFETQVDDKVQNLSQLFEPALMIFLSALVGVLVIAMYLPIFRLGSVL